MNNNIKKEFEEKIQYLENTIKGLEIEESRAYEKYLNNEIKYQDKIEELSLQLFKTKNTIFRKHDYNITKED